jgi:hypothetical protein
VEPQTWCVLEEEVEEVTLVGQGFTGNLVPEEAFCSFRIDDEVYGEYEVWEGAKPSTLNLSIVGRLSFAKKECY